MRLGYTVGSGDPVEIPLKHMCVTGMTQESGKTTTLEALVRRGHLRSIAFRTKRGERAFAACQPVQPFFRERADWVFVSSLIDVTMGEKNKMLRSWLMRVCRTTRTLAEVLDAVKAAKDQARGFPQSMYTEIEGYLELVVPQLAQLPPARALTLRAGLNVMDLTPYSTELQSLVIRSALDHVHEHETDVVVIIPEAWEFLPEGRGSPVKAAAERLIRKGAGLKNYLWLDSQDLGGIWKTIVRSCPVMLIGVQREANEIKRTLANIPGNLAKPKATDVAQLELGQFYACWGKSVVKTYVQPAWMVEGLAINIAKGQMSAALSRDIEALKEEGQVTNEEAAALRKENAALKAEIAALNARLADFDGQRRASVHDEDAPPRKSRAKPASTAQDVTMPVSPAAAMIGDLAALVAALKAEFRKDPVLLKLALEVPEMEVTVQKRTITVDGSSTSALGQVARLLKDGFFDDGANATAAWNEMKRFGFAGASARAYEACDKLVSFGFLTKEKDGYQAVKGMKVRIKEEAA